MAQQSNITFGPSQIQRPGVRAVTNPVDLTGGVDTSGNSLFGDLAGVLTALEPTASRFADRQQKQFVEEAVEQGTLEQAKDPLKAPVKAEGENPYVQDGRLNIWSKAKAIDISTRRRTLLEEISKSEDIERVRGAQKELDDFDKSELQGIETVDPKIAAAMLEPLMRQKAESDGILRELEYKLEQKQALLDYNSVVADKAKDPTKAAQSVREAWIQGGMSGIPLDARINSMFETAQLELQNGNPEFAKALLSDATVDEFEGRTLVEQFQRQGKGELIGRLRSGVAALAESERKRIEKAQADASLRFAQEEVNRINQLEKLGSRMSADDMKTTFTRLDELVNSGRLLPEHRQLVVNAISAIPLNAAVSEEKYEAAYAFETGGVTALQRGYATNQYGKKSVEDTLYAQETALWEQLRTANTPEARTAATAQVMAFLKDIDRMPPDVFTSRQTDIAFQQLKVGRLFNKDGTPAEGLEAPAEFMRAVLTDSDALKIINRNVANKEDREILQRLSSLMRNNNMDVVTAQDIMSNPAVAAKYKRAMSPPTDAEANEAIDAEQWNVFGDAASQDDTDGGILWASEVSEQSRARLRDAYRRYHADTTLKNPYASDSDIANSFRQHAKDNFVYTTDGGVIEVSPEDMSKFSAWFMKDNDRAIDRNTVVKALRRIVPDLSKQINPDNPESVGYTMRSLDNGELLLIPSVPGYEPIKVSGVVKLLKTVDEPGLWDALKSINAAQLGMTPGPAGLFNLGKVGSAVFKQKKLEQNQLSAAAKGLVKMAPEVFAPVEAGVNSQVGTQAGRVTTEQRAKVVTLAKPAAEVQAFIDRSLESRYIADVYMATLAAHEGLAKPGGMDVGKRSVGFGVQIDDVDQKYRGAIMNSLGVAYTPENWEKLAQGKVGDKPVSVEQAAAISKVLIPEYEGRAIQVLTGLDRFSKYKTLPEKKEAAKALFSSLPANQRSALFLMAYNAGTGLADSQRKVFELMQAGRIDEIPSVKWTSGGKPFSRPLEYVQNVAWSPYRFSSAGIKP